jgi:hypothetical protein
LTFSAHLCWNIIWCLLSKAAQRRDGRRIGSTSAERIVEGNVTSPTLRNKATPDDEWSTLHLAR